MQKVGEVGQIICKNACTCNYWMTPYTAILIMTMQKVHFSVSYMFVSFCQVPDLMGFQGPTKHFYLVTVLCLIGIDSAIHGGSGTAMTSYPSFVNTFVSETYCIFWLED